MILVAPTAFKGTIGARAAADAMARGLEGLGHEIVVRPLSDGGPGLIDALSASGSRIDLVDVEGPNGRAVQARVLSSGSRSIVESADACGLHLVAPAERDPTRLHTRGVGQLALAAARSGASGLIMGLGGSATVDGGVGFAAALGWRFTDAQSRELPPTPRSLPLIHAIHRPPTPFPIPLLGLSDVVTRLTGGQGAARVFGPQKGATPETVEWLEGGLTNFAAAITRTLSIDVGAMPGGGAAGGLGAALVAFGGGSLEGGSDWVMRELDIEQLLSQASLVITGEGSYDGQSALGKITGQVIERAARAGVPVLLVAGRVEATLPAHVSAIKPAHDLILEADLSALLQNAARTLLRL